MSEKNLIRSQIREMLSGIDESTKKLWDGVLTERCLNLPQFQTAQTIMFYYSMIREAGTFELLETALALGKRVALPACLNDSQMEARAIKSLADVEEHKFSGYTLNEPNIQCPVISPQSIDLIIVPGVAFDYDCYRLGHGKGYYDRFLAKINPSAFKLGLAYDLQLIAEIPHEKHDIRLDAVLSVNCLVTQR